MRFVHERDDDVAMSPLASPTPLYVSLAEAGTMTGLSTKTLRRRISEGVLPASRTGRLIRIKVTDLDRLFRSIPNARTQ